MIAVLALVLLAGGLGWYYSVGRYVDAPALTNLAEQQAIDKADQAGFTLKVTARAFSETVPLGTIISTDPEPGGRILPGGTINATVSKGKERYAIPDLRGQTVDEARATLAATKLELGGVTEAFDQEIEAGRVIGIDGAAVGDLVKRDTTVAVVVSKGREPLSITDFTGKTQDEATAGLQQIGFTVKAQAAFSDTVPAGVVISQNPASGNGLRGDTITITVSQGPELFPVPDLNGLRRNEAEKVLQDAGFQARSIGIGNFTVRLQDPAAGSAQKRGTTINITGF